MIRDPKTCLFKRNAVDLRRLFLAGVVPILLLTALIASGCSDDKITSGTPPVITSVSPSSASMGDTIVVEGEMFDGDLYRNRLVFSPGEFSGNEYRQYAAPVGGNAGALEVVVPEGAFAGNIRVEKLHPLNGRYPVSGGNVYLPTPYRPFRINLREGDVARALFSSADNEFTLDTGGSKEHLIIIFCNSVPPSVPPGVTTEYSFIISLGEDISGAAPLGGDLRLLEEFEKGNERVAAGNQEPARYAAGAVTGFDIKKREELLDILSHSQRQGFLRSGSPRAAITAKESAPATATFYVLSDYNGSLRDPGSFTSVQADLKYEGDHTLLYLDSSTYGGAISDAEAEEIGRRFDENPQSIYSTDRQAFGEESDINGDGRVAILMTPEVNKLTPAGEDFYIGGFFMPGDLLPSFVPTGCSNGMEIFYTLVPDSAGVYGFNIPKSVSIPVIKSTLAHEFLHMIVFNTRVLEYNVAAGTYYMEDLWLEEGLAHIAESINGYWRGNVTNSNIFLSEPSGVSLIYGMDEIKNRGAAFLFLRYLSDLYGEDIFRELVQSRKSGTDNISVAAGRSFLELFSDWYAALYLNGKGINEDLKYQFPTLDEHGFSEIARDSLYTLESFEGNVRSYGSRLIRISLPEDSDKKIGIQSSDNGRMNAVIVRLR